MSSSPTSFHLPLSKSFAHVPGFTVDARPGRPAAELAKDLADADALVVRSATQVDAKLIAAAPGFG